MNYKVQLFFLLFCISYCICFEFDEDYDQFASTQVSSTKTTSTTTSTTTTTATTTTNTTTSLRTTPATQFGIVPPVNAKRDASETGASNGPDTTIKASGVRAKEVGEYSSNVDHENDYQQNRRRQQKCVSDTEKELLKRIYEIFRVPTPLDESIPTTTKQQPLSMGDLEEATTTTRVERDQPNPYGPVRKEN